MRFFEGVRPQFYFHGARIRKDKKTGRRIWAITLVITLDAAEVLKCDEIVQRNYEHILTLDYRNNDLGIEIMIPEQTLDFFALKDAKDSLLHLTRVDLAGLRMTRVEEIAELWAQAEVDSTDAVCDFVKEYVFTRLWVEFQPSQMSQMSLGSTAVSSALVEALDKMAEPIRNGSLSRLTLEIPSTGQSVTIDEAGANNIHRKAEAARRRKAKGEKSSFSGEANAGEEPRARRGSVGEAEP